MKIRSTYDETYFICLNEDIDRGREGAGETERGQKSKKIIHSRVSRKKIISVIIGYFECLVICDADAADEALAVC